MVNGCSLADSHALYAIKQADSTSGLLNDFAILTISLAPSASCAANFGTSAVTVVGEGATLKVNVVASGGCTYQAATDAPWIQILSGGYGSGNGTLTYLVRPNAGGQNRHLA